MKDIVDRAINNILLYGGFFRVGMKKQQNRRFDVFQGEWKKNVARAIFCGRLYITYLTLINHVFQAYEARLGECSVRYVSEHSRLHYFGDTLPQRRYPTGSLTNRISPAFYIGRGTYPLGVKKAFYLVSRLYHAVSSLVGQQISNDCVD